MPRFRSAAYHAVPRLRRILSRFRSLGHERFRTSSAPHRTTGKERSCCEGI